MPAIVDLSHLLEPGMPAYPGLPEPKFGTFVTHEESRSRGTYAPGTTFQIAIFEFGGNTGTYLDSPFHRHPDGPDLAALPLEKTVNLSGVLVSAISEGGVGPEAFHGLEVRGKAVLVHTNWAERWNNPKDYFRSGPFLTRQACEFLAEAGATLVGIDCANIDDMTDTTRPAHTVLLAAGIPVVEHLCNLEQLAGKNFTFFAPPPAIKSGTTFTVRAFAVCE